MKIGKYVTNMGVLGSIASAFGVYKQTQAMPRDWRRFVVWGIWGAGVMLSVAQVVKQREDQLDDEELSA